MLLNSKGPFNSPLPAPPTILYVPIRPSPHFFWGQIEAVEQGEWERDSG